ncbi:MAG: acylphosphatase [Candidatus Neomarinimicrobiota bacterium]
MKRLRIIVSGRVQGVGFRWATQKTAQQLGVNGYVRNLPSGDVEIVIEGDEVSVERMISWARQGPAFARVDNLKMDEIPGPAEYTGFRVAG